MLFYSFKRMEIIFIDTIFFFLVKFVGIDAMASYLFERETISQWTAETSVVRFDIQFSDDTIVDDHGVAFWTQSTQWRQINTQIDSLCECCAWIGQHANFTNCKRLNIIQH